jgi:hypothetical protein
LTENPSIVSTSVFNHDAPRTGATIFSYIFGELDFVAFERLKTAHYLTDVNKDVLTAGVCSGEAEPALGIPHFDVTGYSSCLCHCPPLCRRCLMLARGPALLTCPVNDSTQQVAYRPLFLSRPLLHRVAGLPLNHHCQLLRHAGFSNVGTMLNAAG